MISEDAVKTIKSTTYVFDEFRLEAENLLLLRNSEVVPLAPKTIEVLLSLVESDGKLITKQEILDKVWAETFVEEANLTHHISALRKALGEDKDERKFIETIPRRGYRFVAKVKDAASFESAEITFNERAVMRVVEEASFETNDPNETSDATQTPIPVAPTAEQTSQISIGKSRRSVWILAAAASVLLIGTAAFFGWRYFGSANKSVAVSAPEISFKRLTPDADANAPSISPDGASILFVKNENGQRSLWRKTIASGELTQLTPAVSMLDVGIFATRFSPDGRWIYYTQYLTAKEDNTNNIYRIPANGGTAQKIISDVYTDFSISPDGKQIAYTFDYRQVIVADIETGNKQIVVDWDGVKRWVRSEYNSVAWSPDGSRLIFSGGETKDNNTNFQLFEVNTKTNELKQISIPENFDVRQIEWLLDDSGLIVTRFTKLYRIEIWFFNYHTGETRRISKENDDFDNLRISADGKTIVACQRLGQFHIWTAPADNSNERRQITIGAAAMHGTNGLAQMPDGRILYTSTESGATDIWMMNADGGERKQLTVNAGTRNLEQHPIKDGRYIVFLSNRSRMNQVWRMDADGKNPVQLSTASESYDYTLSPEDDVYYITFLSDEQKYQIYKVSIEGGEPVRINDYYSAEVPQFSPDGKWILFRGGKTKDEKPRVGIIERESGKIVRYFDNAFDIRGWMPDSKSIVDTMAHGQQLWKQPIDGNAPEKIYDLSPLKINRWNFSADGKRVVFSLGNSTSEIVAIQNFSESVK